MEIRTMYKTMFGKVSVIFNLPHWDYDIQSNLLIAYIALGLKKGSAICRDVL
jgi:hypothetical protein